MVLIHEQEETVESKESNHAPLVVRVSEEVKKETRIHQIRNDFRVEGHKYMFP